MHYLTTKERRALGQARRKQLARQQHSEFKLKLRPAPASQLLARATQGRVPSLVKERNQLMSASPFAYFRGAAAVMAADLSVLPNTELAVQICGDAHVRNLGAFAGADGRLVFDINDFDETIRGPFEWDLKRMAASIVLAGRESGHKESSARQAAEVCAARYAAQMRELAEMPVLEAARYRVRRLAGAEPVQLALQKAERSTPIHTRELLTDTVATKPVRKDQGTREAVALTEKSSAAERSSSAEKSAVREKASAPTQRSFRRVPGRLEPVSGVQRAAVLAAYDRYKTRLDPAHRHLLSFYRPVDVAFKVVGTGSVGLRDYCIYLEGNDGDDPLFLQIKEQTGSVWARWLADAHPPAHNGQRVVEGQRLMQTQSDTFLGWTEIANRQFLVRLLNDHKGSIELDDLAGDALDAYAEVCGELLAHGHARSGDAAELSGYLGSGSSFAEAIAAFAVLYADQTEKDWQELKRQLKPKR